LRTLLAYGEEAKGKKKGLDAVAAHLGEEVLQPLGAVFLKLGIAGCESCIRVID
jgi:hypothetical protein